jgi:hypothetical protein
VIEDIKTRLQKQESSINKKVKITIKKEFPLTLNKHASPETSTTPLVCRNEWHNVPKHKLVCSKNTTRPSISVAPYISRSRNRLLSLRRSHWSIALPCTINLSSSPPFCHDLCIVSCTPAGIGVGQAESTLHTLVPVYGRCEVSLRPLHTERDREREREVLYGWMVATCGLDSAGLGWAWFDQLWRDRWSVLPAYNKYLQCRARYIGPLGSLVVRLPANNWSKMHY